jgi:CDP-paratose 2-epimerase
MEGRPITLYGDGRQVRDVLYVDDLVDAFLLAQEQMSTHSAQAFNIGGGPANTVSLLELLDSIRELLGHKPGVELDSWRTGDQRYYVSDTGKFQRATGWKPQVTVQDGLERLVRWLADSRRPETVVASIGDASARVRKAAGVQR